jgi:hypothetical protein
LVTGDSNKKILPGAQLALQVVVGRRKPRFFGLLALLQDDERANFSSPGS